MYFAQFALLKVQKKNMELLPSLPQVNPFLKRTAPLFVQLLLTVTSFLKKMQKLLLNLALFFLTIGNENS